MLQSVAEWRAAIQSKCRRPRTKAKRLLRRLAEVLPPHPPAPRQWPQALAGRPNVITAQRAHTSTRGRRAPVHERLFGLINCV